MQKIMDMTQCRSTLFLLQCHDPLTGRRWTKVADEELRRNIGYLQHPGAQEILTNGVPVHSDYPDYPSDEEEEGLATSFMQVASEDEAEGEEDAGSDDASEQTPLASNATVPPSKSKQRAKCSIANSPACEGLLERFMEIATGIEDKRDELETELQNLEKRCKEGKGSLEAQIALYQQTLKKEETALAQATSEKTVNEEQSLLTTIEHQKAVHEYNQMMAQCKLNIDGFRTEKCGLEKIRGELYKLERKTGTFQDCEVSDWKAEECSATCGGGTQVLTRTITVYPIGGAACPSLKATQSCSEDTCPVDCVLGDWSGWSGCSADCGGGVRSKSRPVLTNPEHAGEPCGETSKTEACNVQACDVPCVLSDWSAWAPCSKKCDGGSNARTKSIETAAMVVVHVQQKKAKRACRASHATHSLV